MPQISKDMLGLSDVDFGNFCADFGLHMSMFIAEGQLKGRTVLGLDGDVA